MQKKDDSQDSLLDNLAQADFSHAARNRNALKTRFLERAQRAASRSSHLLRLALEVVGLALLGFGFLFTVSSLVNNHPAIPVATQPVPTATPTRTAEPLTPQPTPLSQGPIDMNSSVDAVRIAISQPSWKTLWVEAEIDYAPFSADNNQPDKRLFSQAWLDKNRRGLILSTDFLHNGGNFNLDFSVNSVAILNGGRLDKYDHTSNQIFSSPVPDTTTLEPLAGISPALDLVFPNFLSTLSSEPRPLRMETTLGRPALVADWGNSRLWVDSQTGLVLRAERYTGEVGNSPLDAVLFLRQVLIDPVLDDAVFNPSPLKELTFRPAPNTAQPSITPTPFAETSVDGWVYFQAAAQAPFEWKVYRMAAGCLTAGGAPCPDPQQVPGNPNLQITGLYWAPDNSLAVFSDTNNNQIVAYDPQTRQWPRVLQGFYQPQLIWSQDGSQIAALTDGVDAYDMGLVVIQRDGWTVRDVPTILRGEKQVYGWLDDHTLAVKLPNITIFKGTPPAQGWSAAGTQPGIYRVDVTTGDSELMPVNTAKPYGVSLSPDGKQFAYYDAAFNITVASVDGKESHTVGYTGNNPTWSPDGKWILFRTDAMMDKNQPAISTLYVVRPDGSGLKKVITSNGALETFWSPDSTRLIVVDASPEQSDSRSLTVFTISSATSTKPILPTTFGIFDILDWQK
jgi:sugar lactone lactonase YvrE